MNDKQFVLNSIKMDLHRVVSAVGNINIKIPEQSVVEFLTHAAKDFDKMDLTSEQKALRKQLKTMSKKLPATNDPFSRLRWAEDVMTIRCRL